MKKICKKRVWKVTAFLTAAGVMLHLFNWFFLWNDITAKLHIDGFYLEPENSLDVVLIGASELYTSFNSPLAWEEFGFTSYSLATPAFPGNLYQSALTEVLKRQSPKLVIFEINGFLYSDKAMCEEAKQRKWIDNIPFSRNKLETIRANIPKEEQYSYLFPLFKYHTNWENLQKCTANVTAQLILKDNGYMRTKSFNVAANIDTSTDLEKKDPVLGDLAKKKLKELLEYCREQDLNQVLFMRCPHKETLGKKGRKTFAEIEALVEAYGYDFVNFDNRYEEVGLDLAKDFYNPQHMNIFGMQKYTYYLGEYITKRYNIESEHEDAIAEQWDSCAEYMHKVIAYAEKETLKGTKKRIYEMTRIP